MAESLSSNDAPPEGWTLRGPTRKPRVLFICKHNSDRSQMAEAIMRRHAGDRFEVFSAGTDPSAVHHFAILAMAIRQIDLSVHRAKHLYEFAGQPFDYVIALSDEVSASCPPRPGAPLVMHWRIPDPSLTDGPDAHRLMAFEQVANELLTRIRDLADGPAI